MLVLAGADIDTHAVHVPPVDSVQTHVGGAGIVGEVSVVLYVPSPMMVPAMTR